MSLVRHAIVLAGTALATWWLLFLAPAPALVQAQPAAPSPALRAQLQPVAEPLPPEPIEEPVEEAAAETPQPEPPAPEVETIEAEPIEVEPAEAIAESEPAESEPVAAAELGSRSGSEEAERREAKDESEPERPTTAELAQDANLLRQAEVELGGAEVALGFATTLISEPEQQLQIARAFDEEIVLVPKAALAPDSGATSFRLRPRRSSRKEVLQGLPDLEHARQHRDLFAYDLGRLPSEIRELRRSVIRRDEVFLFAAMIPASEWAIVIGRRREAVQAAGVSESEVERYVLRYVPIPGGGFDFLVEELQLASGEKLRQPFHSQH